MVERRIARRQPVDVFFNKFLGGYPYLCRTLDVSEHGVLVETYAEPEMDANRFPLELRFPGDKESLWLWAKRVRRHGKLQALEFVSMAPPAKRHLQRWLDAAA
jgi:hypothetical protein